MRRRMARALPKASRHVSNCQQQTTLGGKRMSTPAQRPTPETDSAQHANRWEGYPVCNMVDADFARKLERERNEAREQLEAMREAIKGAWVEMQYAEARFAGWALRLAPNDPDTDSVLHKTGEAIRKLQPFLKTKGIIP